MKKKIQTLKLQITHCIFLHEIEAKSMLHHTLLPLFIVWIVLPTCMSCSDDDTLDFQSSEDALKVYQTYLGSLKDMKTSNTAIFCKEANKWRATSDTVFHYLMRDSVFLKDNNCAERFTEIHDSIRFEFLRLTETWRYSYEDVLKDAQALGFAEADPTGDVEGYDAANKLSVLMATAFGIYRAPDSFERVGITGVTMEDLAAAEAEGKVIKLLACAEEKDGGIEAYVKPVAVEKDSFLGRCGSEFNAVQIDCNMAGPIFLQGKGAGPEPTGSAVLGDIIEIAQAIAAGTEHEQPFTALI